MNETILTPRQKYILNLINQAKGLQREEIQLKLINRYPVSKPTLIRDLHILQKHNLIKTEGAARAIKYLPIEFNPLWRRFDLESYFSEEPDKRIGAKTSFDFNIFKYLYFLFNDDELKKLQSLSRSFVEQTAKLSPDLRQRELERFVIELSWKSSKIEGNTYTLLETETLIKEQKEASGRTKHEATMILNHKACFETIVLNRPSYQQLALSTVSQLHNILVKNLDITSGVRKQPVGITGTVYQPLGNEYQLREVLEKTLQVINLAKEPFEKALIAHFMIAYIQPFADGNKRTARMLTNAILLAHDLFPLSYRSVDEEEFKQALILFYEQGSIIEIKRLFIQQFQFANQTYFL